MPDRKFYSRNKGKYAIIGLRLEPDQTQKNAVRRTALCYRYREKKEQPRSEDRISICSAAVSKDKMQGQIYGRKR